MSYLDLFLAQISDPFRLGLLAALAFMTFKTRRDTGFVLPLVGGVLFFAVLLPTTMTPDKAPLLDQVLVGLVVNGLVAGLVLAIYLVVQRRP